MIVSRHPFRQLVLFAALIIGGLQLAHGETKPIQGFIVYSPENLGDQFAKATPYVDLNKSPQIVLATLPEGKKQRILVQSIIGQYLLPDVTGDLSTPALRQVFDQRLTAMKKGSADVPALKLISADLISQATAHLAKFDAGNVFVTGSWKTKTEMEALKEGTIRFTNSKGKEYLDAKLLTKSKDKVMISHRSGYATLSLSSIPPEALKAWKINPLPRSE